MPTRTPAERLDQAVDRLLTGATRVPAPRPTPLARRGLVARGLRAGTASSGSRFEARLARAAAWAPRRPASATRPVRASATPVGS